MKKVTETEMMHVHGGAGYFWRCSCGYKSAWHMYKNTAQTNANNHTAIYGSKHRTRVYYG